MGAKSPGIPSSPHSAGETTSSFYSCQQQHYYMDPKLGQCSEYFATRFQSGLSILYLHLPKPSNFMLPACPLPRWPVHQNPGLASSLRPQPSSHPPPSSWFPRHTHPARYHLCPWSPEATPQKASCPWELEF